MREFPLQLLHDVPVDHVRHVRRNLALRKAEPVVVQLAHVAERVAEHIKKAPIAEPEKVETEWLKLTVPFSGCAHGPTK